MTARPCLQEDWDVADALAASPALHEGNLRQSWRIARDQRVAHFLRTGRRVAYDMMAVYHMFFAGMEG